MMKSNSTARFGRIALYAAAAALSLTACSKSAPEDEDTGEPAANAEVATAPSSAPAAPAAPAPAADNTDTLTGVKFASYVGDAAKGKGDFIACQSCHTVEAGKNKIGPSLHEIVGRQAGTIAGYAYSDANKNSGITWTPEKLFQYLEAPQRVVPGTKMTFVGFPDPQKRADVIAYLQSNP